MYYCRKYWFGVVLVALMSACRMQAGGTLDYTMVESKTYEYYLAKNWKELIMLSDEAFAQGIDYYYLRVRAGIATYELKRYRQSIVHFEKALKFNEGDQLSQEYLYYAYLFSERAEDARKLSASFAPEMAAHMKTKKPEKLAYVFAEAGAKLPDSVNLYKPAIFGQVGLNHYLGRRVSFTHALNYYLQDESRFNYTQYQYYVRGNIPLGSGLMLQAGAHLLYTNSVLKSYAIGQETVQPAPPYPGGPLPPVKTTTLLVEVDSYEKALGLVAAAGLTKQTQLFDFSISGTIYLHDSTTQYQTGAGLIFYPFRNNNTSVGFNSYLHSENKFTFSNVAIVPFVNARLGSRFFVNATALFNKGGNISENMAMFVNNAYDATWNRITLTPSYMVTPQWAVYLTAGLETKVIKESGINYHYMVGLVGLRFTPNKNVKKAKS